MEFPVLFLGAMPDNIPALYSLMNYADVKGGTWYPKGGMYKIVEAMYAVAKEQGVKFCFNEEVTGIEVLEGKAKALITQTTANLYAGQAGSQLSTTRRYEADVVIGGADYHFIENNLLPAHYRSYTEKYWNERVMAPSCLLYYVGLNKKLKNILHHSLFFDVDFARHGHEIYKNPGWPSAPLFYVSATSVSDDSVAPANSENLFFLIPVAAGLKGDTEELRNDYFKKIVKRFEKLTGESIEGSIIYKKTYSVSDFVNDYNAFKGNAYGLANTLRQTAILKPSIKSKKVTNLFYTGQLTVPGPGVPPSLISGEVVAKEIIKEFKS
jgi:phytoene desaturase